MCYLARALSKSHRQHIANASTQARASHRHGAQICKEANPIYRPHS